MYYEWNSQWWVKLSVCTGKYTAWVTVSLTTASTDTVVHSMFIIVCSYHRVNATKRTSLSGAKYCRTNCFALGSKLTVNLFIRHHDVLPCPKRRLFGSISLWINISIQFEFWPYARADTFGGILSGFRPSDGDACVECYYQWLPIAWTVYSSRL